LVAEGEAFLETGRRFVVPVDGAAVVGGEFGGPGPTG